MKILKNITPREKTLVIAVGLIAVTTFLWLGIYDPAMERREIIKRKIEAKTGELAQVKVLSKNLIKEKERFNRFNERIKSRPGQISPIAAMESLASGAGIRDKIKSMSPQPAIEAQDYTEFLLDMKIEKVSLPGLKLFLESVGASQNIFRIKRISIKPKFDDPSKLDVTMSVASYEAIR